MSRVTWIRRGFEYGIILLAVVIVLLVTGCATTQYVGNGQVDPLKMTLMTCKSQASARLGVYWGPFFNSWVNECMQAHGYTAQN
jgi:hypothetical protein